ncbi:MAG TPA: DUF948 domain-containing protein [Thermodesulfobacteriaceae bacterium]|nr:DUF948 domain-containing protein [Thermodesulfobacteriaceae bacterium]
MSGSGCYGDNGAYFKRRIDENFQRRNEMAALYGLLVGAGIVALTVLIFVLLKVKSLVEEGQKLVSSAEGTLSSVSETLAHLNRLSEEIAVLPGAMKEVLDSFVEIARDLSEEVKARLERLDALSETLESRLSGEVPAVLSQAERTLAEAEKILSGVNERLSAVDDLFEAVKGVSRSVKEVSSTATLAVETINREVRDLVIELSAATAGLKEGVRVVSKIFRFRKKN